MSGVQPVISVTDLRRHYGDVKAVDGVSFEVRKGEVFGLLGPNGAGKTTTIEILEGLNRADSGSISVLGFDPRRQADQLKERIGVQLQAASLYPDLTVSELVELFATFYARRLPADRLVTQLGLDERKGALTKELSGGQRQRVMVARSLLLRPRVIIADDPVSMIDASLRATVIESLRDLNRRFGISLVYITHDLTTAYQVSENIVVLYRGAVAEAGDVEKVVKQPEHPYTRLLIGSIPRPDPKHPWGLKDTVPRSTGNSAVARIGCHFADRCPHVMQICREKAPPLYQTAPHRAPINFFIADR